MFLHPFLQLLDIFQQFTFVIKQKGIAYKSIYKK